MCDKLLIDIPERTGSCRRDLKFSAPTFGLGVNSRDSFILVQCGRGILEFFQRIHVEHGEVNSFMMEASHGMICDSQLPRVEKTRHHDSWLDTGVATHGRLPPRHECVRISSHVRITTDRGVVICTGKSNRRLRKHE